MRRFRSFALLFAFLALVAVSWSVDEDRVYLTGGSMGGQGTTIVAAKYPERFAAAVEWMGPVNLFDSWDELPWGDFRSNMRLEIGGSPSAFPWEYERRSPIHYARNLRHMPFAIGHGQLDFVVPPHHARDLRDAIETYRPDHFYGIYWNLGAHFLWPGDYERTLKFLERYRRAGDPPDVLVQSDEDQSFWWLSFEGAVADGWRTAAALPAPASNELRLILGKVGRSQVEVLLSQAGPAPFFVR